MDETALICDFAETYHIYDYRALPVRQAAALAAGLGEDSRIVMEMNGIKHPLRTIYLAEMVDALNILVWFQTENGQKNINRPASVLASLMGDEPETEEQGFTSGEDFEAWAKEMRENG